MKFIINGLLILAITSCSQPQPPKKKQLKMLSNNDLCSALGTYNSNGRVVLEIYDELRKRTEKMDNERCHALEIKAREDTEDSANDYPNTISPDSGSLINKGIDPEHFERKLNQLFGTQMRKIPRHRPNPNF